MSVRILVGDCRETLAALPEKSVQMVCTSPPYFGLRDYGHSGQIGLEPTPDAYVAELVAVFRAVRRVLREDGVAWLNLGDSYATGAGKVGDRPGGGAQGDRWRDVAPMTPANRMPLPGLKPKDLIGVPWLVAKALQAPYYTGRIAREADRAWIAGFLDGEGTITYVERDRGPEHTPTHDVRVFVTNTDRAVLDEFAGLTAGKVYERDGARPGRLGTRPCYRWQMGTHDSAQLLRELYPYLRTKRKQAALVWTIYTTLRHRNGHARTPGAVVEQRRALADMVRALNRGEAVDVPSWVEEPPPMFEPGWYLRSDVIWAKPNPMPESVTDRPTKAHEYLFLLSKAPTYFYDADAVREPHAGPMAERRASVGYERQGVKLAAARDGGEGFVRDPNPAGRNRRSVWTVATQPYRGAHFATMPPALVEPCVLAGSRPGDTVLDPFGGAGTTGLVADRLGRDAILCELNPAYAALAADRLKADAGLFADVAAGEPEEAA